MKAAVYKGIRRLEIEEVPDPVPGPGQVLVKVKYSAICGSDVHRYQHGIMLENAIMGHEYCGEIVQVGQGVDRWKVGDRVVGGGGTPPPTAPSPFWLQPRFDYRTYSLAPQPQGGYAEYVVMDDWRPLLIPEGVSDVSACLTEPCAVAVHGVRLSQLKLCDQVFIIGAGPVGLLFIQTARAAGALQVVVSEPGELRRRVAMEMGADLVLDPTEVDVVAEAVRLTGGLGPDVVIETAGAQPTLQQALTMARRDGQVLMIAVAWEPRPVVSGDWFGREVSMKATYAALPEDWRRAHQLMKQEKLQVEPMLTGRAFIPLEDLQEAFERLMRPAEHDEIQVIVEL